MNVDPMKKYSLLEDILTTMPQVSKLTIKNKFLDNLQQNIYGVLFCQNTHLISAFYAFFFHKETHLLGCFLKTSKKAHVMHLDVSGEIMNVKDGRSVARKWENQ